MPNLTFFPGLQTVPAAPDETILQVAQRHGIPLAHICGSRGRCSICRVVVVDGLENCVPRNPKEQAIADLLQLPPEVRLACQTTIIGDVRVRPLVQEIQDADLGGLYVQDRPPALAGVEKQIFILFADINGFTSFAETLLPYDVIYILNRFFHLLGEVIGRYGGHIDNYLGDGLMAVFEADHLTDGAARAVQAGLAMLAAVDSLKPTLEQLYQRHITVRIGLHYGQVVAGAVGAIWHRQVTVIGDAVNLASRIEEANKKSGTSFLISEDVYNLVQEQIQVNAGFRLTLPGKSGQHTLYEVTGWQGGLPTPGKSHDHP